VCPHSGTGVIPPEAPVPCVSVCVYVCVCVYMESVRAILCFCVCHIMCICERVCACKHARRSTRRGGCAVSPRLSELPRFTTLGYVYAPCVCRAGCANMMYVKVRRCTHRLHTHTHTQHTTHINNTKHTHLKCAVKVLRQNLLLSTAARAAEAWSQPRSLSRMPTPCVDICCVRVSELADVCLYLHVYIPYSTYITALRELF
jgi:hypothetical protein